MTSLTREGLLNRLLCAVPPPPPQLELVHSVACGTFVFERRTASRAAVDGLVLKLDVYCVSTRMITEQKAGQVSVLGY